MILPIEILAYVRISYCVVEVIHTPVLQERTCQPCKEAFPDGSSPIYALIHAL